MSTQPPPTPPQKKNGLGKGLLFGCLGALVLGAVIIAAVVVWVFSSGKDYLADQARNAIVANIEQSELPVEQQEQMVAQIDRVATGFKEGEIGIEQMARVIEEIAQSPVFNVILVYAAEGVYLAPSGLSPEAKEEARLHLHRFAQGAISGAIPEARVNAVLDLIERNPGSAEVDQLKTDLSDEELQAFIDEAKAAADDAGVSQEVEQINLAQQFEQAVDRALNQAR